MAINPPNLRTQTTSALPGFEEAGGESEKAGGRDEEGLESIESIILNIRDAMRATMN
jgi:hypothetical protein